MITLWHNPRCSKSRAALHLLQERGHAVQTRRYLDEPPDAAELRALRDMLGLRAIDMMRPREPDFADLGLSRDDDDARLIAAMAARPRLIERPVAIAGHRAVIGRPPERVLDIV